MVSSVTSTFAARAWRATFDSASCATRAMVCRAAGSSDGRRRQRAGGEADPGAGLKAQRFTLPPQKGDEPGVLDRRTLQLVEHHLHLRHRLARRAPHLARSRRARPADRCSNRACAVAPAVWIANSCCLTASWRSRASRARSSCRAAWRICCSYSERSLAMPRLLRTTNPRERACGIRRQRRQRRREIRARPGDRQVQKDEAGNQGRPGESHGYRGHPLGDGLNEQHRAHHDVRMRKAYQGAPAADRIVNVGQRRARTCPARRRPQRSAASGQSRPERARCRAGSTATCS